MNNVIIILTRGKQTIVDEEDAAFLLAIAIWIVVTL
jgi:hypothetical protein